LKFQYLSYRNDIFESIVDHTPKIYIFDKVSNKNLAKDYYLKLTGSPMGKRSEFLTTGELKERIFLTDKILLKEEKPVLLFYQALGPELKRSLKIDNYYDIIDTAENFLGFYRLLNEFQIDTIGELEGWQEEIYKNFQEIKINYDKLLEKYAYTVQSKVEKIDKLDFSLIDEYSEIVFVNKLYFSPLEKNILSRLCENFEVKLFLQLLKGDFDEDDLCLKRVSCPTDLKTKVTMIKSEDRFVQLINFLSLIEKDSFVVLDADSESEEYKNMLSKNFIKSNSEIRLSESKIFKFLSKWHQILSGAELSGNALYIRTADLLDSINSEFFREYYQIDADTYKEFIRLVSDDYRYITKSFLDQLAVSRNPVFEKIALISADIETLHSFKSLGEFAVFLEDKENFNFTQLDDLEFADSIQKYFEALSEVLSIEHMGILDNWEGYFSKNKISEGLFRLILKYLRHKPLTYTELIKSDGHVSIENISEAADVKRPKLIVLNAYEGILPSKGKNGFLFTDAQKEALGILTHEYTSLLEKHNLFRHIFSCDEVCIFTLENEEKNIEASSFLEELRISYKLDFERTEYSEAECMQTVREILASETFIESSKDILGDSYSKRKDLIALTHDDFNDSLDISSYAYNELVKCRYYFFLKRIVSLQEEIFKPEYKIDAKLLGIISHNLMEEVARLKSVEVKKGNFSLKKEKLQKILEDQLSRNHLKIPMDYLKYYKKIIFPIVVDGVEKFYQELKDAFSHEKIKTFSPEKRDKEPLFQDASSGLNVCLTGRMDLLVETEASNHIYDYKTGRGDISQLDFYSILFYGESNLSHKYIYSILDNELIPEGSRKNMLSRDLLISEIKNFLSDTKYTRTDKNSICRVCEYAPICQMRWENE